MGTQPFNTSRVIPDSFFQYDSSTTPGAYGAIGLEVVNTDQLVMGMIASNTDTIDHTLLVGQTGPGTNVPMFTITVPAGAGTAGIPPVDGFEQVKAFFGFTGWLLPAGFYMQAAVGEAVNSGKYVTLITFSASLS